MKRRDFITLLGGAAITLPVGVRVQGGERVRHIAILDGVAGSDLEAPANLAAFLQELQQLGWSDGRTARFDIRWGESDAGRIRKYAAELAAIAPDVILAIGPNSVAALLDATRTVPIVFAIVPDPLGADFVDSLAEPVGNVTGSSYSNIAWPANGSNCSRRSWAATAGSSRLPKAIVIRSTCRGSSCAGKAVNLRH
jgi:putative tryptophan/tyrosine transport system substrate-binding protein